MNVKDVENALSVVETLEYIREFILVRNHINVKNVGKPLVIVQTYETLKFILMRNSMNVMNVKRPLAVIMNLLYI